MNQIADCETYVNHWANDQTNAADDFKKKELLIGICLWYRNPKQALPWMISQKHQKLINFKHKTRQTFFLLINVHINVVWNGSQNDCRGNNWSEVGKNGLKGSYTRGKMALKAFKVK